MLLILHPKSASHSLTTSEVSKTHLVIRMPPA